MSTSPELVRPSRTSMLAGQVDYAMKSTFRNPLSAFFTLVFPVIFLVIFNLLNTGAEVAPGVSFAQFFTPGIAAFAIITACYTNLAISTVIARDTGVLKRVRGTPLPPVDYLLGRIIASVIIAFGSVTLMVIIGVLLYGVDVPWDKLPAFALTVLVGCFCFCALGLAVTALVPNQDSAPPVVNVTVFPILFISGIFFPLDNVPGWVRTMASVFPIQRLANSLQVAFNPFAEGSGLVVEDHLVLLAWGVGGLIAALRFFRWEPREGTTRRRSRRR